MLRRSSILALFGLALSSVGYAATVSITTNLTQVDVFDAFLGYKSNSFSGKAVPSSLLLSVSSGTEYSKNQIDYAIAGGQTTLSNRLDQKRNGVFTSLAQAYESAMTFTVSANTGYALTGQLKVHDVTKAGRDYLNASLLDVTTGALLAYSYQESVGTVDDTFTLGGSGGDLGNLFSGSLNGMLLAGHSYIWSWNAFTQAFPDSDGGASATGELTLRIGDALLNGTLPEPGSLALVLLAGGVGAAAQRRRQIALRSVPALAGSSPA
jgi:hypothetical protein